MTREPTEMEIRAYEALTDVALDAPSTRNIRIEQGDGLKLVRAVIRAMHEPTAEMESAMKGMCAPTGRELYKMAIDAASPPEPTP